MHIGRPRIRSPELHLRWHAGPWSPRSSSVGTDRARAARWHVAVNLVDRTALFAGNGPFVRRIAVAYGESEESLRAPELLPVPMRLWPDRWRDKPYSYR